MKISRPRATRLSQIDIDADLAMGAYDITLGAGQLVDGVDVSAIEAYVHDGTLVIDGGASPTPDPSAWTDLDLSAYVGSNRAIVILKILNNTANERTVAVRPNGDATEYYETNISRGCAAADLGVNIASILVCETDAAGIIEWWAEAKDLDIDFTLLGYIR